MRQLLTLSLPHRFRKKAVVFRLVSLLCKPNSFALTLSLQIYEHVTGRFYSWSPKQRMSNEPRLAKLLHGLKANRSALTTCV